jgi:hypothetical protein
MVVRIATKHGIKRTSYLFEFPPEFISRWVREAKT